MILQVSVITPKQFFLNKEAEEVILPTNTGFMGVLTNHAPLMTALEVGVMVFRVKNEWTSIVLMGGFAFVEENQITVLVNEAESGTLINREEAEKSFNLAKKQLEEAKDEKQRVEALFAFKKAKARYQVFK